MLHAYFGFQPDLVCFGKTIANGHALSALLGTEALKGAAAKRLAIARAALTRCGALPASAAKQGLPAIRRGCLRPALSVTRGFPLLHEQRNWEAL